MRTIQFSMECIRITHFILSESEDTPPGETTMLVTKSHFEAKTTVENRESDSKLKSVSRA
jgi:hypothetical protein